MPQPHFHERLLQLVWEKQYIHTDALLTTDGQPVDVIHPGRLSLDSGPDMRGARIRIGGVLYAGDVEIHRHEEDWDAHGHSRDPRYNSVILHVLLHRPDHSMSARTSLGRKLPSLVIGEVLARPLEELRKDVMLDEQDLLSGRLHCTGQNDDVPADIIARVLDSLAAERFEIKLRRYEERLRELAGQCAHAEKEHDRGWDGAGGPSGIPPPGSQIPMIGLSDPMVWDQLLYEGLMEGLGYSRNRVPFMTLSRALPVEYFRAHAPDIVQTEALLFGVAGLLPALHSVDDAEARGYVHSLQAEWKTLRTRFTGPLLSVSDWVLSPTRPSNAPVQRLVAARSIIRMIVREDLFRRLFVCAKYRPDSMRMEFQTLLRVTPGPFWERRTSFGRVTRGTIQPLGPTRRDDMIVNGVAPLLLLYGRIFHDGVVRRNVLDMLRGYPALQPNRITRRMERHLLSGKVPIRTVAQHQGALQLFNYYCSQDRCMECEIGKRVWRSTGTSST